jgi:16S rRNA (cytidine1402-2'-O)-methyltransferase
LLQKIQDIPKAFCLIFSIEKKQFAVHQHNEKASAQKIIEYLKDGKHIALVSDAGTPNISDPGGLIVKEVAAAGF